MCSYSYGVSKLHKNALVVWIFNGILIIAAGVFVDPFLDLVKAPIKHTAQSTLDRGLYTSYLIGT